MTSTAAVPGSDRAAKADRRQELLEQAADLFSARGYHATSVRELARRAGILSGSLYSHFDSKADLLYEMTLGVETAVLARVRAAIANEQDPVARFRVAFAEHVRASAEHVYMAKVALAEWRALEGERRAEVLRLRDEYEVLWRELFEAAVAAEAFAVADVKVAVVLVLSVGNWLYQWYEPGGRLSPAEIAEAFTASMLGGFLRRSMTM